MKTVTSFIGAGTLVVVGWAAWAAVLSSPAQAQGFVPEPVVHEAYDPEKIDFNIRFHEGRVERDPKGAIGWKMLGDAYLARCRESDDDEFAWKAEDAARKSIALRSKLNPKAYNLLVNSLLEQHRFQDAVVQARENIARFPDDADAKRLLVDTLIEVGRIDEAKVALNDIPNDDNPISTIVAARIARAEGNSQRAAELFKRSLAKMMDSRGVAQPTLGWVHQQLAACFEAQGDLIGADREYSQALVFSPRSYKATLGKARVAMKTKRPAEAADWATKTLDIANSLEAVAILGDVAAVQGDKELAQRQYGKVRQMYLDEVARFEELGKGGAFKVRPIDRQFATFAATHKMFVSDAKPAAERDRSNRPDPQANATWAQLEALSAN